MDDRINSGASNIWLIIVWIAALFLVARGLYFFTLKIGEEAQTKKYLAETERNAAPIRSGRSALKIYFDNSIFNPDALDCSKVYAVERLVTKAAMPAAALKELFKGPSRQEKDQGFTSFFSEPTADILKSIKIEKDIASLDLKDFRSIIPNAGSSCGSAQFLSEIENTLKQFSPIQHFNYSIEGKAETFYDWMPVAN